MMIVDVNIFVWGLDWEFVDDCQCRWQFPSCDLMIIVICTILISVSNIISTVTIMFNSSLRYHVAVFASIRVLLWLFRLLFPIRICIWIISSTAITTVSITAVPLHSANEPHTTTPTMLAEHPPSSSNQPAPSVVHMDSTQHTNHKSANMTNKLMTNKLQAVYLLNWDNCHASMTDVSTRY